MNQAAWDAVIADSMKREPESHVYKVSGLGKRDILKAKSKGTRIVVANSGPLPRRPHARRNLTPLIFQRRPFEKRKREDKQHSQHNAPVPYSPLAPPPPPPH